MVQWGVVGGVVTGLLLALASPWLGALFTRTPPSATCWCRCCWSPRSASRSPAWSSCWTACSSAPATGPTSRRGGLVTLRRLRARWPGRRRLSAGLVAVWVLFTVVFMGARLVVLVRRARGDAWLVTGTRVARAVPDPA